MGLRGQLNDVGSDSIPLYLVALIAASLSHIRSILVTFFLRSLSHLPRPSSSSTPHHHDSDNFAQSADDLTADDLTADNLTTFVGSGLAGLILLSQQLNLNRDLSYSHNSRISQTTHDDDECIVCLSRLSHGDRVRKLSCSHVFHTDCFRGWIQHMNFNCPLCRSSLLLDVDVDERRIRLQHTDALST